MSGQHHDPPVRTALRLPIGPAGLLALGGASLLLALLPGCSASEPRGEAEVEALLRAEPWLSAPPPSALVALDVVLDELAGIVQPTDEIVVHAVNADVTRDFDVQAEVARVRLDATVYAESAAEAQRRFDDVEAELQHLLEDRSEVEARARADRGQGTTWSGAALSEPHFGLPAAHPDENTLSYTDTWSVRLLLAPAPGEVLAGPGGEPTARVRSVLRGHDPDSTLATWQDLRPVGDTLLDWRVQVLPRDTATTWPTAPLNTLLSDLDGLPAASVTHVRLERGEGPEGTVPATSPGWHFEAVVTVRQHAAGGAHGEPDTHP